ncbi:NAD(P)H-hydrate dehydratase [Cognatishimia sp. SS12]|uniref:NAD(P)H-hydrate dehydratase n=1 Tax=Cognatishimia sp. SS12 TaxID=2979465 RepID=UPI0023313B51|nr:NAD(P)H-hydrate dehydratase [Cognatishimia sp. SS12]MDC0738514.1 NAD(P)H-hydrate dehydratase [Cognatishimia sp. SS12]
MTELLTSAQMRAIEQAAIDSGQVTGLTLMERAGAGVVQAICDTWPEFAAADVRGAAPRPAASPRSTLEKAKRAAVLCGPGNNGGDGFVVARLLAERGLTVDVFLYGDAEKLPPDAKITHDRWSAAHPVAPASTLKGWTGQCYDLVVDALFGTGLSRPLDAEVLAIHKFLSVHPKAKVVAVDGISGIDLDSGKALVVDEALFFAAADLVVTFHKSKLGHFLGPYVADQSQQICVDIGLEAFDDGAGQVAVVDMSCGGFQLRKGGESGGAHKFDSGHALVLAGPAGQTGAARLSARGALRSGAGLVTLGVPPEAQQEAAAQVTAIMLRSLETADDLTATLQDRRINALCLGPALGLDRAKALVLAALDGGLGARPTVLDADALSAFAAAPEALFDLVHEQCVLTPHGGEFARLFPDIAAKLCAAPLAGPAYSKVDATREAAKRAGCVVLLKGAATVIAAPDGRCSLHSAHYARAAPWLATAGAGDVLAGIMTGLMARGLTPFDAAETAAWLHVECALKFGPGLIAEDIPEQLPAVFKDLGL